MLSISTAAFYSRLTSASPVTCRRLQPLSIDTTLGFSGIRNPDDRKQAWHSRTAIYLCIGVQALPLSDWQKSPKATSRTTSLFFPSSCFSKQNSCMLLKLPSFLLQLNFLVPFFPSPQLHPYVSSSLETLTQSLIKYIHTHLPSILLQSFFHLSRLAHASCSWLAKLTPEPRPMGKRT